MANKNNSKPDNYDVQYEQIATNLDPSLQAAVIKQESDDIGRLGYTSRAADGSIIVDVVAKLKDPAAHVPDLNVVRVMGNIVTARVKVDKIEAVRGDKNVLSLKAARKVKPALEVSVPEVNATQQQFSNALPDELKGTNGAGVIVGIVDIGCDFRHRNFRDSSGNTRLLSVWQQRSAISKPPAGFADGREISPDEINDALKVLDPYQHLGYSPFSNAHGTHVMDIAAGNGRATQAPGMAPASDLVFVDVGLPETEEIDDFGNSVHLLEAVDYIFEIARNLQKSAVVNISLASNAGPHDGTTLVEQGFERLLEERGRAIVIAASNFADQRLHASGNIGAGLVRTLRWDVPIQDFSANELEVWYDGALQCHLLDPDGTRIGPFALGSTKSFFRNGEKAGIVFHRQADPNNALNQIQIRLDGNFPSGTWSIELATLGNAAVEFHAWIESDPANQSTFLNADVDTRVTLGSICCGPKTIVVGSYNARSANKDFAASSSEGPTRNNRQKPELSAPGQRVSAAKSTTQDRIERSGTSMAAPHVTGLVALLMQATAATPLTVDEIRSRIIDAARRDPPAGSDWHSRYGFGRINALATLQSAALAAVH